APQFPVHQVEAAASIYRFDYSEDVPSPLKSDERGTLVAGVLGYTFAPQSIDIVLHVFGEVTRGDTFYDGTQQDGTPLTDDNSHTLIQVEGTVGWDVAAGLVDGTRAELYTGLGYRFWKRELQGPSPFS